jgi:hypothetical protein
MPKPGVVDNNQIAEQSLVARGSPANDEFRDIGSWQMLVCELMKLICATKRSVDKSLFVTGCFAD